MDNKEKYVYLENYKLIKNEIEKEVSRALKENEFKIYIQPKIDTKKETLVGAESLIRWNRYHKEMIRPDEFIPLLEEFGIITKLDYYVLEEVCKMQRKYIEKGIRIPISINESKRHLSNKDYVEELMKIVKFYNIPTSLLELEMTESAVVENVQMAKNTEQKLHQLGFIVSMDDFGTGYSSFSMLKDINIDILKIDKSFFQEIIENERGKIIIESIIQMTKKLGIKTVAEGIETKEQVEYLKQIECDMIQGYYYAPPIYQKEFEQKWLKI